MKETPGTFNSFFLMHQTQKRNCLKICNKLDFIDHLWQIHQTVKFCFCFHLEKKKKKKVLFLNVVFSDVFGNLFLLGQKFTQILLIEKQSHFFLMERETERAG